tara:strand:- start:86 stop:742 length:657 start_codon:yes stop_codon:yes gene_type:complete
MAFNLQSKFTSNGLIRNVKTGASPFLQTECLQYGVVNGERKCVKRTKVVSGESVPFSADPDEKEKQQQWIKNNPEKYKEMLAAKNTTLTSSRDVTSGEIINKPTSEEELATRKLRQRAMAMYKKTLGKNPLLSPYGYNKWLIKNNLDLTIKKDFQASIDNRARIKEKNEKRKKYCKSHYDECYGKKKEKKKTPPKNIDTNTTIVTDDELGEWSKFKKQ